jgi:hypothetical protein
VIRYALACDRGHAFESWFNSSEAYDTQRERGLVTCPSCGSATVDKAIMAPSLVRADKRNAAPSTGGNMGQGKPEDKTPVAMMSHEERAFRRKLKELRDHLISNADYVGGRFPEEARRMHYGEIEHRSIYGEASPDEVRSLSEEGIEFHPLPRLPDDRN